MPTCRDGTENGEYSQSMSSDALLDDSPNEFVILHVYLPVISLVTFVTTRECVPFSSSESILYCELELISVSSTYLKEIDRKNETERQHSCHAKINGKTNHLILGLGDPPVFTSNLTCSFSRAFWSSNSFVNLGLPLSAFLIFHLNDEINTTSWEWLKLRKLTLYDKFGRTIIFAKLIGQVA